MGSTADGTLKFLSVDNSGNETEIKTYTFKQTDEPIDVKVNLNGVENLKIELGGKISSNESPSDTQSPAFYNVYFLGK